MLYARINKEYVDEDALANRRVLGMYRKQNGLMYGKEQETSLKPQNLSGQLKYGIDSLFENFRNAVEQVLSADYNGDLTQQKGFEVIKKYNQLSSYLKNIINLKELTKEDQGQIEKQFIDMKDKLELFKKIATDNNFLDKDDIIDMVDKINKTTSTKQEIQKVSSKSTGMVTSIKNKNEALKTIKDAINTLDEVDINLKNNEIANNTKLEDLKKEYKRLFGFFTDADINPLEYALITSNSDALTILHKDILNDIEWFHDTKKELDDDGKYIKKVIKPKYVYPSLVDNNIYKMVGDKIEIAKASEINKLEEAFNTRDDVFKLDLVNINQQKQDILDIQDKWDIEEKTISPDTIRYRDTETTTFMAPVITDYEATYSALLLNNTLNETELAGAKIEIDNIVKKLRNYENVLINNILVFIDNEIKKLGGEIKVVTIQKAQKKTKKKAKTIVAKVTSNVKVNIIFTTYKHFKDEYIRVYKTTQSDPPTVYKVFAGDNINPQYISSRWKSYSSKDNAYKAAYFT